MTLIFGMGVDLDLGLAGIVGQGRRSKVKVKWSKSMFCSPVFMPFLGLSQGHQSRSGSRSKVEVKVKGRGQGQMAKNHVLSSRSRSKVEVKVKGPGQGQMAKNHVLSSSFVVFFWRVAVDTRGSALLSAAKANNHPQV